MRIGADKSEQKVIDDIKNYGWHFINVLEDENHPPHAFSIGLYETYKHPEIIIIGLDQELMHSMISSIVGNIKSNNIPPLNKPYANLLEGFDCFLIEVEKQHYENYVGYARWYYEGNNFPLLQCVWPTTQGHFPWETDAPEDFVSWQAVLGQKPSVT